MIFRRQCLGYNVVGGFTLLYRLEQKEKEQSGRGGGCYDVPSPHDPSLLGPSPGRSVPQSVRPSGLSIPQVGPSLGRSVPQRSVPQWVFVSSLKNYGGRTVHPPICEG